MSCVIHVIIVICHCHRSPSSKILTYRLVLVVLVLGSRFPFRNQLPENRSLEKRHWPPKNQPPTSHYLRINLNKSLTLNTWSGLFHIFSKSFHLLICLICSFCSTNWRKQITPLLTTSREEHDIRDDDHESSHRIHVCNIHLHEWFLKKLVNVGGYTIHGCSGVQRNKRIYPPWE